MHPLLLAVLLGGAPAAFGGPPDPAPVADDPVAAVLEALPARVEEEMARADIPGLSLGVVIDGEVVLAHAAGVADQESGQPVTPSTVFRIGSVTKLFTGAAILLLRDGGRLDLDDPVEEVVPELARVVYPTTDSPRITWRHLVTHGSGLPKVGTLDYFSRPDADVTPEELLAALDGTALLFAPGTRSEYSNLGMAVAGLAAGRVAGQPYRDLVTERLLQPLGMTSSTWEPPGEHLATGYVLQGDQLVTSHLWRMGAAEGMGGLYSDLTDMLRFAAWELSAWPPRDDPDPGPVRRSSVRESQLVAGGAPAGPRAFGVNWVVLDDETVGHLVFHTGSTDKYSTSIFLAPHHGVGVVVLCNIGNAATDPLAARTLRDLVAAMPALPVEIDPAVEATLRDLLALFGRPDPEVIEARFSGVFLNAVPAERIAELLAQLGALGACEPRGVDSAEGRFQGHFHVACENGDLSVMLAVDAQPPHAIEGFSVRSR